MKSKGKWLVLSAVLAFVTSYLLLELLKSNAVEEASTIPKIKVVVAASDIGERHVLEPTLLKVQEVNADQVHPEAIRSLAEANDAVTRQRIVAGEVLLKPMLSKKEWNDGSLFAMKVPGGMRAVSISNSELIGVGGLLVPGDRVDVIVGYQKSKMPTNKDTVKLVLQNIKVLAVGTDSRLDEPVPRDGEKKSSKESSAKATTTVTLAVSPEQAETLVFADLNGDVRLALRSVNDKAEPPTGGVTNDSALLKR